MHPNPSNALNLKLLAPPCLYIFYAVLPLSLESWIPLPLSLFSFLAYAWVNIPKGSSHFTKKIKKA